MSHEGNRSPNRQQNSEPSQNKSRKKATAVVLSAFTCVFMCGLGYEIIQSNQQKSTGTLYAASSAEPVKRHNYSSDASSLYDDDDEYLSYELKMLRDQNKRQAAKIKSLKQEIVDKLQEQHDLKSSLFKQEGDPRDKAKIAELGQQLAQKELVTVQLQQQLKELEIEKQTFDRKILHAEVTKEALTTMLEQQRSLRDQEIAKLKIQMAEYNAQKDKEHDKLRLQLVQYEDTHQRLRENLEENGYASFYLESEINHLSDELHEHKQGRKETETALLEQLYNTVASLELSEIEAFTLKKRLNQAYLRHSKSLKENNARIGRLEKELKEHRKNLREKNAALDSIHDLYSIALIQIKKQIGEVSNYYEAEKTRSETLEDELAKQIETKNYLQESYKSLKRDHRMTAEVEKRLQETNEKMAELQNELESHKFTLSEKERHLAELEHGKTVLENRYQDQIQDLAKSLEKEQNAKLNLESQTQYLSGRLELENARHESTKLALADLGHTQRLLEDQVQYTLTIEADLDRSKQKAAELQAELEYQRLLVEDKELQIDKNTKVEREKIAMLEQEIDSYRSSVQKKHDEISQLHQSKSEVESELEDRIYLLTQNLEEEQNHIHSLESQLLSMTEQLEKEKTAHESTRLALLDHNQAQDAMSDQHRYTAGLEKKLLDSKQQTAALEEQVRSLAHELAEKQKGLLGKLSDTELKFKQELEEKEKDLLAKLNDKDQSFKEQLEKIERTYQSRFEQENELKIALQQEIDSHKNALASAQNQLGTLSSLLDNKDEIINLNQGLEYVLAQERSTVANLESQLSAVNQDLAQVRADHDLAKQSLSQLDKSKQTLQEHQRITKEIEIELQVAKQKAAQLEEERDLQQSLAESYDQRIRDLQKQDSEQVSLLKREIAEHKNAMAQKNELLNSLHDERQTLENHFHTQITSLRDHLSHEQNKASDLESELASLSDRLEEEQNQHRITKNSLAELDTTKRILENQLSYVATIEQELENHKQKVQHLKDTVSHHVGLVENGKKETEQLEKELKFYAALVESKEQNIREHEQKEADLNKELIDTIARLTADTDRESEHSRDLQEQMYALEQQYHNEQEHSKNLQSSLIRTERTIASLEGELNKFQTERENTSVKIAELEAQVNALLQSSRARETAEAKRFEKFNHR